MIIQMEQIFTCHSKLYLKNDESAAPSSDQMMERYSRQIFIHTAIQMLHAD